eukprot:TRINITY_DN3076_c0_g1_i21.p1 TRINITY_DN3076_c0_g1~~TRINITY_DN3076_c0_g1_i21.p1  ORF type:complete len:268 (+),score=-19.15 TRINITY_DN3076_c0_g1_i21:59-862(+)
MCIRDRYMGRIRGIYIAGEASFLDILLNATGVTDFLDKAMILRSITMHDKNLIDKLESEKESLNNQQTELNSKKEDLQKSKDELNNKKQELNKLSEESGIKLNELQSNQNNINNQLKSAENSIEKISSQIENYYKNKSKSGGGSGGGGNNPTPTPTPPTPTPSGSGYAWPVPYTRNLTQTYGPQRGGYFHKGIDISAGGVYGKPIVAAHDGTVNPDWYSNGTWGGGYGTYCMIDNDDRPGYSTLSAHMSSIVAVSYTHLTLPTKRIV